MLDKVNKVILVLSGKGGVGKSTVATQLTLGLAKNGKRVGILDIDLCGPSIGLMFNLDKKDIMCTDKGWEPIEVSNLDYKYPIKVMSIAFLLKDENSAVIWRGPKKTAMIKQFLSDVDWNDLDYLIVDTPPGTSDEHISIAECLRDSKSNANTAVVVTTPQMIAINDVRRELSFCVKASIPVLGIIENMSGFICPNCSECNMIFSKGGGKSLAEYAQVPFLGSIPIEPELADCMDNGENYLTKFENSECSNNINEIVNKIIEA